MWSYKICTSVEKRFKFAEDERWPFILFIVAVFHRLSIYTARYSRMITISCQYLDNISYIDVFNPRPLTAPFYLERASHIWIFKLLHARKRLTLRNKIFIINRILQIPTVMPSTNASRFYLSLFFFLSLLPPPVSFSSRRFNFSTIAEKKVVIYEISETIAASRKR